MKRTILRVLLLLCLLCCPTFAAGGGSTVTLTKNTTINSTIVIETNTTFDLNGFTLSLADGASGSVFRVRSGAALTIADSSKDHTGTITGGNAVDLTIHDGNNGFGGGGHTNGGETCGGGVHVESGATLIMTGGTITGNKANQGGGIFLAGGSAFRISGAVKVTGNFQPDGTTADNVFLPYDARYNQSKIQIADSLDAGAVLGVYTVVPANTRQVVITSGLRGKGTEKNFTSDRDYYVVLNADKEAVLSQIGPPTITQQPQNIEWVYGETASNNKNRVSVTAEFNGTMSYQWYTAPTSDGPWKEVKNATGASYVIPAGTGTSAGDTWYYCEITGTKANYGAVGVTSGLAKVTVKKAATTMSAPKAKKLTYSGAAQKLVTAGTATGGTMQYAIGTAAKATQSYTTSIPSATDAGTYYVWYKVKGDANHFDSEAKAVTVTIAPKSKPEPQPKPKKKTNINNGLCASEKKGVVTFQYGEVSDADSYVVYFRYCGTGSQKPLMTVKGAKNTTVKIKKFGGKKINRKRSYTLWVVAKKGKKVLKTSAEIHVAGSKRTDETNAASVSVKKSKVTLKKNKTSAIKATVKKAGKGKLHKSSKIPQIRYSTSNKKVATVNKKGVIKAVRKGKCKIKVMALNGVCTYVTVTVTVK